MLQDLVPVSIEIDDRSWSAADPQEICRGECAGPIEYVKDAWLADYLDRAKQSAEKCIYICDSASTRLRPLIPYAQGFIFGEGTTLSHFAGVLRYHRIPACIDHHLWQSARDAVFMADAESSAQRRGKFRCGQAVVLSGVVQDQYCAQHETYRQRLRSHRLTLPVYDMANGAVDTAMNGAGIGEKALAVNALLAEGMPTAKTLILTNLNAAGLDEDRAFASLVEQVFPSFGRAPGYALIVRGSLHSDDGSHSAWTGSLKSPSVTSYAALREAIATHAARWNDIRAQNNRLWVSVVVQERIPAAVRGILGTGRPWEYGTEGVVAELTFDLETPEPVFLADVEAGLQNGAIRDLARRNTTLDGDQFCELFARLVRDGLMLRDRYEVPLDIEFVVTSDLRYVFVQFRPLFRF